MSKTITTKKQELCWLYHEYTWTKEDYDNWKKRLINIAEKHNWKFDEEYNCWNTNPIALAMLIKDLEWDEVVTRFKNNDDLTLDFPAKDYNGEVVLHTVSLIEELADAMGEDAWDADYEIGDACDIYTEYEFDETNEEDE